MIFHRNDELYRSSLCIFQKRTQFIWDRLVFLLSTRIMWPIDHSLKLLIIILTSNSTGQAEKLQNASYIIEKQLTEQARIKRTYK